MDNEDSRAKAFTKNLPLEEFIVELSRDLSGITKSFQEKYSGNDFQKPLVILMAPMRSGTTLFMQWIASLGCFAYPSNLLSRFYFSPVLGAKIQELLTSSKYAFRDELADLLFSGNYFSENGKTSNSMSPNEFWYFWDRFTPENATENFVDHWEFQPLDVFRAEIAGMIDVFDKPLVMKGMKYCMHMDKLASAFPDALFLRLKRDNYDCAISTLKARQRQFGSFNSWYSIAVANKDKLLSCSAEQQVAEQVLTINDQLDRSFQELPALNKLEVSYDDFCHSPKQFFELLKSKMAQRGENIGEYQGLDRFLEKKYERNNTELLKFLNRN